MQVCKYGSMLVCKHASMEVCTYMQVCKYACMQVCKYASMLTKAKRYVCLQLRHFLVHTLTFCKRPICSTKCLYCGKVMNECSCMKAQEKLFKFIYTWVKGNSDNTVFSEDLIHIIFDYYCSQGNKDIIEASDHAEQYLEVDD